MYAPYVSDVSVQGFSEPLKMIPCWLPVYAHQRQAFVSRGQMQDVAQSQEALRLARELSHPASLTGATTSSAILHVYLREARIAQTQAEAALTLAAEQRIVQSGNVPKMPIIQGWTLAVQGQAEAGAAQIHEGLKDLENTGGKQWRSWHLTLLAEAYGNMRQVETGVPVIKAATGTCTQLVTSRLAFAYQLTALGQTLRAMPDARNRKPLYPCAGIWFTVSSQGYQKLIWVLWIFPNQFPVFHVP